MTAAWPRTEAEALAVQDELRARVERAAEGDVAPVTVAGLHVRACRVALWGATVGGQIGSGSRGDRGSATLGPSTAHRGKGARVV